jgi:hypothetical protein
MEPKVTQCEFDMPLPIGIKADSILKLHIEYQEEEEDGSGNILIEWDENDADLQWWNDLGEERQQQFILNALTVACEQALANEESDNGI